MKQHYTLFLILVLMGCGNPAPGKQSSQVSVAQKLAIMDGVYDTTDIRAVRIRGFVGILSGQYEEPVDTIGEYTYRAKQVLDDRGIPSTCLGIMEEIFQMDKPANSPYKESQNR